MALTYQDIFDLRDNETVKIKTQVAIVEKAMAILDETTPGANRFAWAVEAVADPSTAAGIVHYVLVANKTVANQQAVIDAPDSSFLTEVGNAIDKMYPTGA